MRMVLILTDGPKKLFTLIFNLLYCSRANKVAHFCPVCTKTTDSISKLFDFFKGPKSGIFLFKDLAGGLAGNSFRTSPGFFYQNLRLVRHPASCHRPRSLPRFKNTFQKASFSWLIGDRLYIAQNTRIIEITRVSKGFC